VDLNLEFKSTLAINLESRGQKGIQAINLPSEFELILSREISLRTSTPRMLSPEDTEM
jgi:hypothetical protein